MIVNMRFTNTVIGQSSAVDISLTVRTERIQSNFFFFDDFKEMITILCGIAVYC